MPLSPPTDTPRSSVGSRFALARLFRRFLPLKGWSFGVFMILLVRTVLELLAPLLMGEALDRIGPAAPGAARALPEAFITMLWLLGGVMVLRAGAVFWSSVATQSLGQELENRFRTDLFTKVAHLHFKYHDANRSGTTIARSLRDMEKAKRFFREVAFGYAELVLLGSGSLIAAFVIGWMYGAAVAAVIGLAVCITLGVGRQIAERDRVVSDQYDEVTTVLQENVAGARVVRAFGREPEEVDKFGGRLRTMTMGWRGLARYWTSRMPGVSGIYHLTSAVVLLIGAFRISRGLGSFGEVASMLFLVSVMKSKMRVLTRLVIVGQEAVASATRVFEVLDHEEEVRAPAEPVTLPAGDGELRIEGVHFAHRADLPILRGLDLVVPAGTSLGVLGPTGSGKSTLAALLPRYYDPDQGRVLLDGVDIRALDPADLRKAVGLVFQEAFLFSATVRDNISYGRPDASFDEIVEAARLAAAHEFVEALPEGYMTLVGERGVSLSGGQRQRLTIARALAMHPRVLVFDDATAAVDALTEKRLFEGIRSAARGRTALVISQRVTSVRWCDRIAVLEDGRVSAVGTHDELVQKSPLYQEIARHQSLVRTGGAS